MNDVLLPFVVLLPLVAASIAVTSVRAAAAVSLLTAGAISAAVAALAYGLIRDGPWQHHAGAWGAPFGIELYADGASVLMLMVTAVVGSAITVHATAYFESDDRDDRGGRFFWPLWLFVWAALNAVFVSADFFNLYVCLELLSLAAVALVALEGSPIAVTAALRYLLVSLAGSLAFLLGVAIVYGAAGTLALSAATPLPVSGSAAQLALALMTTGLLAKAALVPLHFWLPAAHAVAPAPASAALSALVVKAAFYIVLRLWTGPFDGAAEAAGTVVLGALGAVAILWGSLLALRERRVKMIVACSTIAQLGYLLLMFPLLRDAPAAAWNGGMFQLLSHALAKSAMFLTAGSMIRALGDDGLDTLTGVGHRMPLTFAAFGLAGLNLVGMPPSGGFIGKWFLLTAAVSSGQWWWAIVIGLGSLLAASYVLLVLRAAFARPIDDLQYARPPWRMTIAALTLAVLALVLGAWGAVPLALIERVVALPGP